MRIGDVVIVVRNPRTLSFLGHVVYAVNLCEKRQLVMHFRNVIVWFQVVDPVIPEMAPTYYSVIFPENCIKMKKTGLRRRGHVSLTVFNQDQYLDLGQKINSPPNDYLWLFLQLGTRNITNKIIQNSSLFWDKYQVVNFSIHCCDEVFKLTKCRRWTTGNVYLTNLNIIFRSS